jgi:hypothetical protein
MSTNSSAESVIEATISIDEQMTPHLTLEAIRGDQRRSEAIRGDQRRSEAI